MKRFNDRMALKITGAVGTMWCAYLFAAIALISLPQALESQNVLTIVSWVAQTFLQLVLLSVIQNGQNIIGGRQDQLIEKIEQLAEQIKQEEDEELADIEEK